MSAAFEAFLARIYVDSASRARFLAHPRDEASRAGLGETEIAALERIDPAALELAARSFERKRARSKRDLGFFWKRLRTLSGQ